METEEIKIEELPTEGAIPTEETPIEVASEESYADIEEKLVDDEDAPEIIDKENIPGYLKITSQNLKTLHRHLVCGNWFNDHEKLAEYYEYIDEMEDGVVEIFIGLGLDDMTIAEAADKYAVLENREYKMPEAFMLAKLYFEKLQRLIQRFKEDHPDLPGGVVSKLEEYEYWLFLESKFKLTALLKGVEVDEPLMESLRADIKR